MKNKVPTLKEAAFITYKRRKNGDISAKDFLNSMNHNVEALGNIPVNKITTSMISKMNDYNKARPAAITQEISEIVGGAAAV